MIRLGPYVLQKLKLMQSNAERAAEEGQAAAKETTVPQLPPITSEDHSIEFAPILEYALHAKAPAVRHLPCFPAMRVSLNDVDVSCLGVCRLTARQWCGTRIFWGWTSM